MAATHPPSLASLGPRPEHLLQTPLRCRTESCVLGGGGALLPLGPPQRPEELVGAPRPCQDPPGGGGGGRRGCPGPCPHLPVSESGWLYGERLRDGETGWFPEDFVQSITNRVAVESNVRRMERLRVETDV